MWHLTRLHSRLNESNALEYAKLYGEAIAEFRSLYTQEVIQAANAHGMTVTHDYKDREGAIPLPATLSMLLGRRIGELGSGARTQLYSAYPFPWRKDENQRLFQDPFARDAWEYWQKNPDSEEPFYRFEDYAGRPSLRYAVGDRMRASCVACHNSHPDTPKNDWRVNDVRGVLEIITPMDSIMAHTEAGLEETFVLMGALATLGGIGLVLVIGRFRRTATILEARVEERTAEIRKARDELSKAYDETSRKNTQLQEALDDITQRKKEELTLRETNQRLREVISTGHEFEGIVGDSPAIGRVLQGIETVAPTDTAVLILGETGTGKELVARAVHRLSQRKDKPLVTVNCAALASGVIESELFGHERGAFTGAVSRRAGRFELADGGTVFLDEIGDLPAELQAKLLRVLQEGELERVGGTRTLTVDVRVVAATNRNLQAAVQDGSFRSDLYYRLNVFPLKLPLLRERKEDIPLLVHRFLNDLSKRLGKPLSGVSESSMRQLMEYGWPGNVRELMHVIERAAILARSPVVQVEDLVSRSTSRKETPAGARTLEDVERTHILTALEQASWVIEGTKGAAQVLGLHPNTLRYRLRKLGIQRPA